MKVWYFICILFALYSINILIEEGSKIIYVPSNDEEIKLNYILACFNLKQIFSNKTTIDLQQLNEIIYAYYDNYFSKVIDRRYYPNQEKFKVKVNESILNPIKAKNYFVLRDQFCLIIDNFTYVLIHSKNHKYYIFKNDTYDFFQIKSPIGKF